MNDIQRFTEKVAENVEQVIVGKREVIDQLLVALLCEGHVLIEDAPGMGKTMLARSLAISLGLEFKRVQCTPDLLPNDITGVSVFNQKSHNFEFRPGPVFTNVLLADEINRANPRTQSALLEAMGEGQVTVDGATHRLKRPFFVLATQNPIEYEGTYPLPEAQLDRFLMRLHVGYPGEKEEDRMLQRMQMEHPIEQLEQVVDADRLPDLHQRVREVHVGEAVRSYLLSVVRATRDHKDFSLGASPRSSLGLFRAGQARAAMQGKDYVTPYDVKAMVVPCLEHRIILRPESSIEDRRVKNVLEEVLEQVDIPVRAR
ncbi:MAG: MoxR family ATPase [Anaerolineales bacterium]|nr:MoxR family ATPase [Anaerolineales bacterium]